MEGLTDTGSFLNPDTGIITLDFNVTSGTWHHESNCTEGTPWVGGWLVHGWVMDLISYSGATELPNFRGANSFPDPRNIGDAEELLVGTSWAGFNRFSHSGQDWDDWVEQYDYDYGNNQDPAGSLWGNDFRKGTGGQTGAHLVVYRLRIMVAD
jgi:hypothetical protein